MTGAEWWASARKPSMLALLALIVALALAFIRLGAWQLDRASLRGAETARQATAERLAVERGLLGLPGPFFGPGQERYLRLAFANAAEDVIAQVPSRL